LSPWRRALLLAALLPPAARADDGTIRRGRELVFPRDHGAHLAARTEWWYATGWLGTPEQPSGGFQVTFFRSRTGFGADSTSRFAPRHLLFAHAALTTLGPQPQHRHAQRITRWSGAASAASGAAAVGDGAVRIGNWSLVREADRWRTRIEAEGGLRLALDLVRTQPLLLQGDGGFSRKGPEERQASHYYSEPQLRVEGSAAGAADPAASGRAWLDHEWSEEILHPQAVGWDWIGMNLFDGSALTAFVLRRRDGSALWAGGSFRRSGDVAPRSFAPQELRFAAGRLWQSPASQARYPVQWTVECPAGRFTVNALLDAQELDGRGSTGSVYWEGVSELLDAGGRRVGLGYLEMTGYAAALRL
jgi:predicted secreted hydrolase